MEEKEDKGTYISDECWEMLEDIANHHFVDKERAAEMAITGYYKALVENQSEKGDNTIH
jgi:hypothetical protein